MLLVLFPHLHLFTLGQIYIVCRRRRYPKIFLWVQHLLELRHRRLGYLPGIAQLRCEYLIGWMNWYVARAALVQFLHIEDDGQGQANVHEELASVWCEKKVDPRYHLSVFQNLF